MEEAIYVILFSVSFFGILLGPMLYFMHKGNKEGY